MPPTIIYYRASSGVTANLANPAVNTGEAAGDTYSSIEELIGSNYADTLTGDANDNSIYSYGGDDSLYGGNGNDELSGGAGADALYGGNGNDIASYYGAGSAVVASLLTPASNTGDAAGDTYNSIENLFGSDGYGDTLTGDANDNWIRGFGGNDTIYGGDGWDSLDGGLGADALYGGNGNDAANYYNASAGVTANLANSAVNTGEAAGDTYSSIEYIYGSNYADTLTGDANFNFINGNGGNDSLYGGDGDDELHGGAGADALYGGNGNDIASYYGAGSAVVASLLTPASNTGDAAGDTYNSIENLFGSDGYGDTLTGDANDNYIRGFGGNDTIYGGDGWDNLEGGLGADALYGGNGNDAANYYGASAGVTANLANSAVNTGEAAGDTYSSIEYIYGSNYADTLTGDANFNFINGNGGNDSLYGGDGNDELHGGAGADAYYGGNGEDIASYYGAGSAVVASLLTPASNTGDAAGDTYNSIEDMYGSYSYGDTLTGDANGNYIMGFGGNDTIYGGDGNDDLEGSLGADALYGGNGSDFADYYGASAGVTANLANSAVNTGEAAGDSYNSIENIYGSSGYGDTLTGDANGNYIYGFGGNDTIAGSAGNDTIYGGSGSDTAKYAGNLSTYSVTTVSGGVNVVDNDTVADGNDGTDFINGIEYLQFKDQTIGITSPIILDLDGDGVEMIKLKDSETYFDMNGDGTKERTGWIGKDDGFLVLDRNKDGIINDASELSFINDKQGAVSDLDGLSAYDSNSDGKLSAEDDKFGEFQIWRDKNSNGITDSGELITLAEAGIVSISLDRQNINGTYKLDQNIITAGATFQKANGGTGYAADAIITYAPDEVQIVSDAGVSGINPFSADMLNGTANNFLQMLSSGINIPSFMNLGLNVGNFAPEEKINIQEAIQNSKPGAGGAQSSNPISDLFNKSGKDNNSDESYKQKKAAEINMAELVNDTAKLIQAMSTFEPTGSFSNPVNNFSNVETLASFHASSWKSIQASI